MRAFLQLVSTPLNPIPIAEDFRRSHPRCETVISMTVIRKTVISMQKDKRKTWEDRNKAYLLRLPYGLPYAFRSTIFPEIKCDLSFKKSFQKE